MWERTPDSVTGCQTGRTVCRGRKERGRWRGQREVGGVRVRRAGGRLGICLGVDCLDQHYQTHNTQLRNTLIKNRI